jgi:hypothetical protein
MLVSFSYNKNVAISVLVLVFELDDLGLIAGMEQEICLFCTVPRLAPEHTQI